MDTLFEVGGAVGYILVIAGAIAHFGNRKIRDERNEFVEKQRDDYKEAFETERAKRDAEQQECKQHLADQDQRIARLEGRLEQVTGDWFQKIGDQIGDHIIGDQFAEQLGDRIGVAILRRIGEGGLG